MSNVGLDIGSYAIKILVGKKSGQGLAIERAVEVSNPIGSVLASDAEKRQKPSCRPGQRFDDACPGLR